MLVRNNLARDSRVRKEAQTVSEMGFDVTVIGVGTKAPEDLADAPYQLLLTVPYYHGKPLNPKLGRETTWYPIRILVNLTVTAWREWRWHKEIAKDSSFSASVTHPDMESMGLALVEKPDIVHCHDLDTLWAGYRIAQQRGALLVYDSHELYPALHYLREDDREQYIRMEPQLFPHLDAFITVSPEIGQKLVQQYQSPLEPIVLYNGGKHVVSSVTPVSTPVRLFFQGAFAIDRNNVELIDAMRHLRGKATLTLQGWGQDEDEMRRTIAKYSLEDIVTILPPVPPFEVVDFANNYDVGVINSVSIDENFAHTLPNKLFDYMCGGLAIASTSLPPIKKIIDKEHCGITYEQRGVEHTAKVLEELVSDPQRIQRMKKASLAAAPYYAWPAQAKKLTNLYEQLASKVGTASEAKDA